MRVKLLTWPFAGEDHQPLTSHITGLALGWAGERSELSAHELSEQKWVESSAFPPILDNQYSV